MICCDRCDIWYHWKCVGISKEPDESLDWYCTRCVAEIKESEARKWKVGDKCKIRLSEQDIAMIHKRGCFRVHGHEYGTWQGEVTEVDSDFCKVRYDETDDFVQFHWLSDLIPINDGKAEKEKKSKAVTGKCETESEYVGSTEKEEKNDVGAAAAAAAEAKNRGEKAVDEKSGSKSGRSLWVSGLAPSVQATDLQNHFSKAGKVTGAKVLTNSRTPFDKCFGFVTVATKEEADKILKEMAKTDIAGGQVTVGLCKLALSEKTLETLDVEKEKEKRVTKVGETSDSKDKECEVRQGSGEKAIREMLAEAVECKAAMRKTVREMEDLAEIANKKKAEIKRFKTVVREEGNQKQHARLRSKLSKLKGDHKQLQTANDEKNSEMDKVEARLEKIQGRVMITIATCADDLYAGDTTILEEVKRIFPNILEKLLKVVDQSPDLEIKNVGLRREISELKAEKTRLETGGDLLQKQQDGEIEEGQKLTDEQIEEWQRLKMEILECVVVLRSAKEALPGLAEVVESQKQIRNEIKALLKTKETAKLRRELSKAEEVLKDAVEAEVRKRTKIREEERKLARLRDRLEDIDNPESTEAALAPAKPAKWRVGDKCRVNVKIKHKPKECEAEIMELPEDSSDANVSIHGYGYLLPVPLDQLGPSKGDKERAAQWDEAINYHIMRVEEPSKDDKKVTEEDIQVSDHLKH